jgi:hypothetical protein
LKDSRRKLRIVTTKNELLITNWVWKLGFEIWPNGVGKSAYGKLVPGRGAILITDRAGKAVPEAQGALVSVHLGCAGPPEDERETHYFPELADALGFVEDYVADQKAEDRE